MKQLRIMLGIICAMLLSRTALAESGACSYYAEAGDHSWVYLGGEMETCTTDGYYIYECTVCKLQETEYVEAYGHELELIDEEEAGCTGEGYSLYECIECGYCEKHLYIPVKHDFSDQYEIVVPTCIQEGLMLTACDDCGQMSVRRLSKKAHAYGDWSVTVQPTDISMGVRTKVCSVCQDAKDEAFYPDGTLYRDIYSRDEVRNLQSMLTDCGYLDDQIDGEYGPRTESAVKEFQTRKGLNADGIAWPRVRSLLQEEWQARMTPPASSNPGAVIGRPTVNTGIYVRTTGDVNLRIGPGLGYAVLKAVKKDVDVGGLVETAVDERGVVWYGVSLPGGQGWVSSKFAAAFVGNIDYSAARMPFVTSLNPSEYYMLDGGMELANYYLCSMDVVNEALGLDGLVDGDGGREASSWAVRIGGDEYVEEMELFAGGYSIYGVTLNMHIDEAVRMLESAGLFCSGQQSYSCTFERPCTTGSIYINESGFDSYITVVFDRSGYVRKMTWQPCR